MPFTHTRLRRRIVSLVAGLTCACALAAPSAQARAGLTLGFFGDPVFTTGTLASRDTWLSRATSEGAGIVRLNVNWSAVAPRTRASGFNASNPASPGYNWTSVDAAVRAFTGRGLKILMNVGTAPNWAEAPGAPSGLTPGSWKPSASDFGQFATAIATRYDGSYPDPLNPGRSLPRVSDWQGWNEPNLSFYLSPQWTKAAHGYRAVSPTIYRQLENAFYHSVKAVSASNFVVLAGLAPFGDLPGGQRMQPVAFDRYLFCLQGRVALKPFRCPSPVYMDALDHHPYGVGGPTSPAYNADDVAVPDYHKLTRVLHAAQRAGHVLPKGHKPLWVTEMSWDTRPPDPHGVPIQTQARWIEQAFYVLWKQHVSTIMLYEIADAPPIPNYADTYQAGIYYINGKAKPSATAYAFPFVTNRLSTNSVQAWGRSPAAGRLKIEQRVGGTWKVLRSLSVGRRKVFETSLTLSGKAVLRAQVAGQTSLTWTQSAKQSA